MLVTFGPPISVQNMSDPWFYAGIPAVYTETPAVYTTIYLFGFHYDGKVYGQVPVGCLQSVANAVTCKMRGWEGRVGAHWWKLFCSSVRAKLFWRKIYCANPRPDTEPQSGYRYRRGMGRQAPGIMQEYDIEAAIAIRTLTHPRTCEMVSLSFPTMSWLKFASTTRAYFPSMPSTDRKNGEKCFHCSWKCLPRLSFFYFSP